jgi:tripartite-type tricarboxylate transporter receptor subunit TctC
MNWRKAAVSLIIKPYVASTHARPSSKIAAVPEEPLMAASRRSAKMLLASLAVLAAGPSAFADDYPTKPVQIINQAAPGSGTDVLGRIVAEQLAKRLGQQVVIVSRPGAGGLVAAQAAAAALPDGYTLYMPSSSALMVLPQTHPHLSFDFHRDFVPIGMVGTQPLLIAVSPSLGVSSLPELIALAKKQPGKILFAGNTPGTLPALTGEMLKQRAGIDMTFVPYPGFATGLTDPKGGRISVIFESLSALAPAVQDGSVKLLAVAAERRLSQFPDVPTVAETLAGFVATGWLALLARTGTPDSTVQKLSTALRASLADAGLKDKFAQLATLPAPMTPAEMQVFIAREEKNWIPVIQKAGLATE